MKKTPLKRKTPLKSYTKLKTKVGLKSHKPMNRVSKKQAKENAEWSKVKAERIVLLIDKYDFLFCENCSKPLKLNEVEGHHNDHNRRNNTLQNCRATCHTCNCYTIEDNNIRDVKDWLK